MPQYILLLRDDPSTYLTKSPAEQQALLEKYMAWGEKLGAEGRLLDGKKLVENVGRTLSKPHGRLAAKDGPFGETKEVVGGFYVIRADDLEHAARLCADHPQFLTGGSVEIREVDFMGQPED